MGSAKAVDSLVAEALAVEPSESVAFRRLVALVCVDRFDTCRGAILGRRIAPTLLSCWNRRKMEEFPHGPLLAICLTPEATRDRCIAPLATDDIIFPILGRCEC